MLSHIFGVNDNGFARKFRGTETDVFQHFLHDGVQPSGADVLRLFVDLLGIKGDGFNGVLGEVQGDAFRRQQRHVLLD